MMRTIMNRTNDINKYCKCAAALRALELSESKKNFKSSMSDPTITKRMRYAERARSLRYITVVEPAKPRVITPQFPTSSF